MKILLIGEYSRLHNSLKEGLIKIGHTVILVGTGDDFKRYPIDVDIRPKYFGSANSRVQWFRKAFFKLFKIDIAQLETGIRFFNRKKICKGFDVVQLINESALNTIPKWERKAVRFLRTHNKKLFLLSSGDDFYCVTHMLKHKTPYNILTPYFNDPSLKKAFRYTLKYVSEPYQKLSRTIYDAVDGIIASDIDYHLPLLSVKKYRGIIPNPVNIDSIPYRPLQIEGEIKIFHGINAWNYHKKGNRYFEEALAIILKKYPDKVKVITTTNLPYNEYITTYSDCHIVLDQVYSYDQGYNALEAMAKGKVVFTGAEHVFTKHYNITAPVAINARPDLTYLVQQLSFLIENPQEIYTMSKNARTFIENHHNYIKIAQKYILTWS